MYVTAETLKRQMTLVRPGFGVPFVVYSVWIQSFGYEFSL